MGTRRGHLRQAVTLFACGATLLLGGCLAPTSYGWEGDEQAILAAYSGWTLRSDLPKSVNVSSVIASAQQTLQTSGYTITARDATSDSGRIVARPPDGKLFRRIVIEARRQRAGAQVAITIEPGGNETMSREVLERMLSRLGL